MNKYYIKKIYDWVKPTFRNERTLIQHCDIVANLKGKDEDYVGNLIPILQYLKYCDKYEDENSKREVTAIISFLENTFKIQGLYKFLLQNGGANNEFRKLSSQKME